MLKKRIEGNELKMTVPEVKKNYREPVVELEHGFKLDAADLESHTAILGESGSGKTTLLEEVMEAIFPQVEEKNENVIVFAVKEQMLKYCRPGDILIRADQSDADSAPNFFQEMKASSNPELCAKEIAESLFADQKNTVQPFFTLSPQEIFEKSLLFLYDYVKNENMDLDNNDLKEFLLTTPVYGTEEIPGWIDWCEKKPQYFACIRDYLGEGGSDQSLGVLAELRAACSVFWGGFSQKGGKFSAIESIKKGGKRIFLYYDYASAGHSSRKMFKLLLDMMIKQSLSSEIKHHNWYILDEISILPKMDLINSLSIGREFGFRCILGLQSAKLLCNHYSKQEAEILLSLCQNMICFRTSDAYTRSLLAGRYGKARYQYSYVGMGEEVYTVDAVEPVISDFSFGNLVKSGNAIMSLAGYEFPFLYEGYRESLKKSPEK